MFEAFSEKNLGRILRDIHQKIYRGINERVSAKFLHGLKKFAKEMLEE